MTLSETSGFEDRVHDSQSWFRVVLRALSRPGVPVAAPLPASAPEPLSGASAALALSLFDADTSVWLDPPLRNGRVEEFFRLHSDATLADACDRCHFAIVSDANAMPALSSFAAGTAETPNTSATVIVHIAGLEGGEPITLEGPGIDGRVMLAPRGLASSFWTQWEANTARFPLGVDVILTDGRQLLGLPRTSRRV